MTLNTKDPHSRTFFHFRILLRGHPCALEFVWHVPVIVPDVRSGWFGWDWDWAKAQCGFVCPFALVGLRLSLICQHGEVDKMKGFGGSDGGR